MICLSNLHSTISPNTINCFSKWTLLNPETFMLKVSNEPKWIINLHGTLFVSVFSKIMSESESMSEFLYFSKLMSAFESSEN